MVDDELLGVDQSPHQAPDALDRTLRVLEVGERSLQLRLLRVAAERPQVGLLHQRFTVQFLRINFDRLTCLLRHVLPSQLGDLLLNLLS